MKKATLAILCLEGAVLSFNVAACAALIPSIARDFGVAQFVAGRVVWLYMLPYGVAALLYGPLARRFDAKRIELVCFFLFCAANVLAGLSRTITSLFAARFLMGVFGASVIPLILVLIAQKTEAKARGRLVGIFFSATFVASLVGLFLSGVIAWRWIFLIPAITGFILWICMAIYLPDFHTSQAHGRINYRLAFRDRTVIALFLYIFLISLFYHGIQQWLSVYFSTQLVLGQFSISLLVTLTSLSGIFGEVIGGWCADSLGRVKTINVGIALMSLSAFLLVLKTPPFFLALVMVLWGLGWTLNHAGISTVITDLPHAFLNEAASLNSSVRFVSGGLGVMLGGWLMHQSFMLGFACFGVCLVGLRVCTRTLITET